MRALAGFGVVCLAILIAAASCGSDSPQSPDGGSAGTAGAPSGGGGNDGGGGADGGGGNGGAPMGGGGGMPGCDDCPGTAPICDEGVCVSECPDSREACRLVAGEAQACCAAGEQCCAPGANNTANDLCWPAGEACPTVCPDGVTTCGDTQLCQEDLTNGTWSCVDGCQQEAICNSATVCCPLGSRCENGNTCPLADLVVDSDRIANSYEFSVENFPANSCAIVEGCVMQGGDRKLMRFDLRTPNEGAGDMFMGNPNANQDLFEFSPCHSHYHFNSYAEYRLLDMNMQVAAVGHKQAFCLIDIEQWDANASPNGLYDCGYQGIQAGWADIYGSGLDCQWVDVTDVAPGEYLLEIRLNTQQIVAESDYTNNTALVPVTIAEDSCPAGCTGNDPMCCQPGDPCNLGVNDSCDCDGLYEWDAKDCGSCQACNVITSCPGGCTPDQGQCCGPTDTCGNADNGVCDCAGAYAWDANDCGNCISADTDCPTIDSCPFGCPAISAMCCQSNDPCGYANDGYCDCQGGESWDFVDCFSCGCLP